MRLVSRPALIGSTVVALVLAACGPGEEVPLDGDPADLLHRAVERTEGTLRLQVHAITDAQLFVATEVAEGIAEPDGDSRVTITRSFDFPDDSGSGALGSSLDALAGTTELVTVGGTTYRTLPEDGPAGRGPSLPPGIEWVADRGGPVSSVVDLRTYLSTRGAVDLLTDAVEVEDAGPTEIDDIQVRRLKATAPDAGAFAEAVGAGVTIDVAVDGDGVIRRLAFVTEGQDGFRTRIFVDIGEFGVDETVEPPPAEVTIDRSELDASESPAP